MTQLVLAEEVKSARQLSLDQRVVHTAVTLAAEDSARVEEENRGA